MFQHKREKNPLFRRLGEMNERLVDMVADGVITGRINEQCHRYAIEFTRHFHCIASRGYVYIYHQGYYIELNSLLFGQIFQRTFNNISSNYTPVHIRNTYKLIHQSCYVDDIENVLNNYPQLIPFKNGYYNIDTNVLEPFTPRVYITNHLPFKYRTDDLRCPLFIQTINEIFKDNEMAKRKYFTFMRYCLTSDISLDVALILLGSGNNAKTFLTILMMDLMGKVAATIKLSEFQQDKGAVCRTKGKYLIYSSEIGGEYIKPKTRDLIKDMITNTHQSGRDAFKVADEWKNTAKFIFDANYYKFPRHSGGKAFYRRFIPIDFKEDFTGREKRRLDKQIKEEESSSILSYIVNNFTDYKLLESDWKEMENLWILHSEPSNAFLNDMCVEGNGDGITTDIYIAYTEWCNEKESMNVKSSKDFNKMVGKMGHPAIQELGNEWRFKGLRLATAQDKIDAIQVDNNMSDITDAELEAMEEEVVEPVFHVPKKRTLAELKELKKKADDQFKRW